MHKTFKDIKDLDTKIQRLIIQELNKLKQNNNINEFKEKRYIKGQVEAFLKDIDIEQNIDDLLEDTFTVYNGVADYSQPYDLINFKDQQREMLNDTSRIFDSLPYSAAKDFVEMNKDINKMIASGEVTINQAVKTVSDNYSGVKIRYKNGSKHKFSDYLFMVYQTNQTAACKEQSFRNAEDIGTELFIFSGVMDKNIRDDCLFLLDKIVAFGKSGTTTDLYDNVIKYYDIEKHGYGEPGGALGIRCTHILFPFVEGISTLNNYNRDIIGEVNQLDNSKETKVEAPAEEKEFDANELYKRANNAKEYDYSLGSDDRDIIMRESEQWLNSLTEDEQWEAETYTSDYYKGFNNYLNNSRDDSKLEDGLKESYEETDKELLTALQKYKIKEDTKVFRGMSVEEWEDYGEFGEFESYKSTTLVEDVANDFKSTSGSNGGYVVEMILLKEASAAPIIQISKYKSEAEVLVSQGNKYVKIEENDIKKLIVFN